MTRLTSRKPAGPTARARRAKAAKDKRVAAKVRAVVAERDGYCRLSERDDCFGCDGVSEWAHMHEERRSKTRGLPPDQRHTTQGSLMLCKRHHDRYDGRSRPRLIITALSNNGADGLLRFELARPRYESQATKGLWSAQDRAIVGGDPSL